MRDDTTWKPDLREFLRRSIKDIIHETPAVAKLLNDFGIGCTDCSIANCMLAEIVDVHGLSPEDETRLLGGIASLLFPGAEVEIPKLPRSSKARSSPALSPPLRTLVEEHAVIKRLLRIIPALSHGVSVSTGETLPLVRQAVEFIRTYADGFHHAKEENVLFKFFDTTSDIVASFLSEHETGRAHVRTIVRGLGCHDTAGIIEGLEGYRLLLQEHITKEDDILYPWMNRSLSDTQVGHLFSRCAEVDEEYRDTARKGVTTVAQLERLFPVPSGEGPIVKPAHETVRQGGNE